MACYPQLQKKNLLQRLVVLAPPLTRCFEENKHKILSLPLLSAPSSHLFFIATFGFSAESHRALSNSKPSKEQRSVLPGASAGCLYTLPVSFLLDSTLLLLLSWLFLLLLLLRFASSGSQSSQQPYLGTLTPGCRRLHATFVWFPTALHIQLVFVLHPTR
ncbi:hypothetical protein V8C37DRAFT_387693 [Trichoderma ceciliae]